jgi:hypothetical protein
MEKNLGVVVCACHPGNGEKLKRRLEVQVNLGKK